MDFESVKSLVEEFFNGQYEVLKFLGEGSFAQVYLARHKFLQDLRAMKIIKESMDEKSDYKSIFSEVQLATRLRHENIISIYDAGIIQPNNLAYFVMEYVPGGDLEQYRQSFISSHLFMPIRRTLDLLMQIANGLNVLHSSSPVIVHRDLKPKNILLNYSAEGRIQIKISDFGFAKEVTTGIRDIDIAGTRPFMAPECFSKQSSTMSDIYAVGVIFYLLLTNEFPYEIDSYELEDILDNVPWNNPLKPPSEFNELIPDYVEDIVVKCLHFDSEKRYRDAGELSADLKNVIGRYSSENIGANVKRHERDIKRFYTYVLNDDIREAFKLAKRENQLPRAIEILEKEVLGSYTVRKCYASTLEMWKSERPDLKLISNAFSVNLRGDNYKLAINYLQEAIAFNPSIKSQYQGYIQLWSILDELEEYGNLIKAVFSLEELMNNDDEINEIYKSIIHVLKTFSHEEIVAKALQLADSNNFVDAGNLMEFAAVSDVRIRKKYGYRMSLWKQNMKSSFSLKNKKINSIDYAIDLGTNDSVIAYMKDGEPRIVKNYLTGDDFTSSSVYIDDYSTVHVGEKAKNALIKYDGNAVSEFKQNMGFQIPFLFKNSSRIMFPEELSAEVLKSLRKSVFVQYGVNMEDAVISVPANSNPLKTKATNDAANLAGFRLHPLILEPVAVAIAYGLGENETSMIYDIGGGTFKVSLVENNSEEFEMIAADGLDNLGGNLFDWKIVDDYFAAKIIDDLNLEDFTKDNPKYSDVFLKLKNASENSKKELSKYESTDIFIHNLFDGYDFTYHLTKEMLKEIMEPYIKYTFNLCWNLLNENNLSIENIDRIILAGGTCLSPIIHELLEEEFQIPIDCSIDPLTVVARGSAIYAATIEKSEEIVHPEEFSVLVHRGNGKIKGKVFSNDEKFSYLGFRIEFHSQSCRYKKPLDIDGTFNLDMVMGDEEFEIRIFDLNNEELKLSDKSMNSFDGDSFYIPYLNRRFKYLDGGYGGEDIKGLLQHYHENHLIDDELIDYLQDLLNVSRMYESILGLLSLYISHIEDELSLDALIENIDAKLKYLEKNNSDVDNDFISGEFSKARDERNRNRLEEIYRKLIEDYVSLNRDDAVRKCFFDLSYDGIYTKNQSKADDLISKGYNLLDDYEKLFEIVKQLFSIDER